MSSSSHYLLGQAAPHFLHGLISNVANPPRTLTFSLRCAETAAPATLILVIYMYCIYKVQSLLLHIPHFQHHIIHSDKLGLSQTAAYDPARSLGSVTQRWRPHIYPAAVDQLLCDAFHGEKRFWQWPEKSVSRCYLVSRLSSHCRRDVTLCNRRWQLVLQHWHNQMRSLSTREDCKIYTQEGIC